MSFFHFGTIRKYTAALLDAFNNIEIQKIDSTGRPIITKVPIQYANQEKSTLYDQLNTNEIYTSNNQILPRMILSFNGMSVAPERAKNKFVKINAIINDQKISHQFNSIPYDFNFTVTLQARGMNEASLLIEQICSFFNPTYTLRIQEIPVPYVEPSSIVVDLESTNIEQEEIEDLSINIVTCTFDLKVRGNIYPPFKDIKLIKAIQVFLHSEDGKRNIMVNGSKISNQDFDITISDITYDGEKLSAHYVCDGEKLIRHNFIWKINGKELSENVREITHKIKRNDIVELTVTNEYKSASFTKKFDFKDLPSLVIVNDIVYQDGFIICEFTDQYWESTKYTFDWYFDDQKIDQNTRMFKIDLDRGYVITVKINTKDGRESKAFKKLIGIQDE